LFLGNDMKIPPSKVLKKWSDFFFVHQDFKFQAFFVRNISFDSISFKLESAYIQKILRKRKKNCLNNIFRGFLFS